MLSESIRRLVQREVCEVPVAQTILLEDDGNYSGPPELVQSDAVSHAELTIGGPHGVARVTVSIFEDEIFRHGNAGNDFNWRFGIGLYVIEDFDIILKDDIDLTSADACELGSIFPGKASLQRQSCADIHRPPIPRWPRLLFP